MSEAKILREVQLAAGGLPGVRLFRNQVGQGVAGNVVDRLAPDLLVVRGRPVTTGLCAGSPDLIGWQTLTITPDMVGSRIARFVGLEVKSPTGRVSPEQQQFLKVLTEAGGLAEVVRSADDARKLVDRSVRTKAGS